MDSACQRLRLLAPVKCSTVWTEHGAGSASLKGQLSLNRGFDLEAVCRELRLTLEDAVRKWMVADVEVGSFLSGGLDSSIIAALASRAIDPPVENVLGWTGR